MMRTKLSLTAALTALLVAASSVVAMPGGESLLPANTHGCLSIPSYAAFLAAWEKTSSAALWYDPAMKALRDTASARLDKGELILVPALGLVPEELKQLAQGKLTLALLPTSNGVPAVVLLLEVQDAARADQVVARVGQRLAAQGASASAVLIGGERAIVYVLPQALRRGGMSQLYFLRKGDCLLAASHPEPLPGILGRLSGTAQDTLAAVPSFQATTVAAQRELRDAQCSWYVDPLPFAEALLTFIGEPTARPNPFAILKKEGFDAVRGAGGVIGMGTADYDFVARSHIHAPQPYQRAMRMLPLPSAVAAAPPAWVPQNVGSLFAFNVNYRQVFDAYACLFDAQYGEGDRGAFEDLVRGLRDDPAGPRVDVRKEIVAELSSPTWIATLRPARGQALQGLLAAPVTQEKTVAEALRRLLENDDEVRKLPFGAHGAWQLLPPKAGKAKPAAAPRSTLAVAQQALLIADTPELLATLHRQEASLSQSLAYQSVLQRLHQDAAQSFFQGFFNHEELYHDMWIYLQSGKQQQTGSLGNSLQKMFLTSDASFPLAAQQLPAFTQVSRHARSYSGIIGAHEDNGWKFLWVMPRQGR